MAEHTYCDNVGLFILYIFNSNILASALSTVMFDKLEVKPLQALQVDATSCFLSLGNLVTRKCQC